jgi:hypothetical protein
MGLFYFLKKKRACPSQRLVGRGPLQRLLLCPDRVLALLHRSLAAWQPVTGGRERWPRSDRAIKAGPSRALCSTRHSFPTSLTLSCIVATVSTAAPLSAAELHHRRASAASLASSAPPSPARPRRVTRRRYWQGERPNRPFPFPSAMASSPEFALCAGDPAPLTLFSLRSRASALP